MDNDNLTADQLKALVFGGIFDSSCASMNAGNVTLEYAYIGVGGYNLWQDISKGPTIDLGSLTHKFGEDGTETIRLKYSDDKYGSFEQTVELNVFDSCYSSTVAIQTIAPAILTHRISLQSEALFSGTTPEQVVADILAETPVPPAKEDVFNVR